ncbi:MAG: adenosylcobalamin-dependent ribonucleoside-diphosphate reductase [Armatimonadota bacterium]|nr:adenosylcobalamin-dependent ribonucleoside-diphosphate reductase [Armatimonadota bacterium]MDR7460584.1 adenosylcobalamin-dependent ribonucleoside-diphosphate reductase [Armatimonadota bacterium]MDR7480059.1 adenosylcobalamin-dependent ribonucleoside-diphosphate reductase [Armatimonadota bacterium]MDR7489467.1 adenosylcobalamin-dependent ribonucleoside-diphosphate reductase [Armatimonadota bacterium]MDR7490694.1 adenosylcobalamin-dependent ribonucleoside-diphosphate reductase [Armatimonadota
MTALDPTAAAPSPAAASAALSATAPTTPEPGTAALTAAPGAGEPAARATDLPPETLAYFQGDELRARVFYDKYALRDREGRVLERTPPEMWRRIARELAGVEAPARRAEWEEKFTWLLEDFRFIPGGRIMHAAGNPKRVTSSNCYVIPIQEDSIEAIFEWMKEAARTYSFGGGVGGDISCLRPRGAPVNNAARSSTGSVSFMELMSLTTGTIGQSGRRGALMITIADHHPDVLDFVRVKRNLDKVRYANISVRVSDAFMRAVEQDAPWELVFENEKVRVRRTIRARHLWEELIRGARDYAEPGVIFWDTVKRWSTSEYNGMEVITTNPCSEIPLEPYGNCNLGNVNLARFVAHAFTPEARVDWQALERALRYATRFLDNILDYNADRHPLSQQREASLRSRRIGVGFTGLGDMLIMLGLKYDTDEAVAFVDRLFERIKVIVYDESVNLAREKGPFPAYDPVRHFQSPFIQALPQPLLDRIQAHGLRNVALLTVPPVGSGAALAGVTSGIEPIFDLAYIRRSESLSQETFKVYHPLVREYMARVGLRDETALPPSFVTAHQIKPEMRVKMQAAIQKHIDHAISSTVNLPHDTPVEEVERIYFLAWKLGCKGITVYREGSREGILLTTQQARAAGVVPSPEAARPAPVVVTVPAAPSPASPASVAAPAPAPTATLATAAGACPGVTPAPRPRPKVTVGRTERVETPRGRIYVVVNEDEIGISEVFVHSFDVEAEAIGRLASLALRAGVDPRQVLEQLWRVQSKEVALDRSVDGTVVRVSTIAQAVALALGRALYGDGFRPDRVFPRAEALPEPAVRTRQERLRFQANRSEEEPAPVGVPASPPATPAVVSEGNGRQQGAGEVGWPLEFVGICPDCGANLIQTNGCATCPSCGYARC